VWTPPKAHVWHALSLTSFHNVNYGICDDSDCTYQLGSWVRMAPDDAEDRHFGWLTADVSRLMRTVFDRRVKALGLTRPQWLALVRLNRRPGASQSELADMMEIEKAPAGKIVDRMEEKGWVERRPDASDRRINRIHLTDRGERIFAAIQPISLSTVDDALEDLSPAERDRLTALLSRVKSSLLDMADSDPTPTFSLADASSVIAEEEAAL
jgi:MarR family transcriptional regulator, transcriptional regulator for hemolysin